MPWTRSRGAAPSQPPAPSRLRRAASAIVSSLRLKPSHGRDLSASAPTLSAARSTPPRERARTPAKKPVRRVPPPRATPARPRPRHRAVVHERIVEVSGPSGPLVVPPSVAYRAVLSPSALAMVDAADSTAWDQLPEPLPLPRRSARIAAQTKASVPPQTEDDFWLDEETLPLALPRRSIPRRSARRSSVRSPLRPIMSLRKADSDLALALGLDDGWSDVEVEPTPALSWTSTPPQDDRETFYTPATRSGQWADSSGDADDTTLDGLASPLAVRRVKRS